MQRAPTGMGAISDQILAALGLRSRTQPVVMDAQAVLMSKLAAELCSTMGPAYLCGPSGCGKTTALEPLARALIARPGHCVLALVLSDSALPGFEDNPWCVVLDDGSEMELAQFMHERPAVYGRLELPMTALLTYPTRHRVAEGLERLLREELRRGGATPTFNALTIFVDEPTLLLGEADLVTLTEAAASAAGRFVWVVQTPPAAALQAQCHHALFMGAPNPMHLPAIPRGALRALTETPLARGELGYVRMNSANAGNPSMLRVAVSKPAAG